MPKTQDVVKKTLVFIDKKLECVNEYLKICVKWLIEGYEPAISSCRNVVTTDRCNIQDTNELELVNSARHGHLEDNEKKHRLSNQIFYF